MSEPRNPASVPRSRVATLDLSVFLPFHDKDLNVTLPTGKTVQGTLVEINERGPAPRKDLRAPFSLVLRLHKADLPPNQCTLRVEIPKLGVLDLFAVPVDADIDSILWQIIFG
jgi:hypothetical protein